MDDRDGPPTIRNQLTQAAMIVLLLMRMVARRVSRREGA
jgi:hypothetical protein